MLRTITTIGVALTLITPAGAGAVLSPDADDNRRAAVQTGGHQMTPDARDANDKAQAGRSTPRPTPAQPSPAAPPADRGSDGFGWGDAGIGAAGTLGLGLALAGTAVLANQRRREQTPLARS